MLITSSKRLIFKNSNVPLRVPVVSPSTNNISNSTVADRTNFPRGVTSRSTFHAGQQRASRDQHASTYNGPPASPSLSHGNSQVRRTGTGIFSKFTSKFVRRWVQNSGDGFALLRLLHFTGYKMLTLGGWENNMTSDFLGECFGSEFKNLDCLGGLGGRGGAYYIKTEWKYAEHKKLTVTKWASRASVG